MRILHITPKPIFPLIDGGCVAMSQFLQNLLKIGDEVHHSTISTLKHPFEIEKYNSKFFEKVIIENGFINTNFSIVAFVSSLVKGNSYHVERFYSQDFANKLSEKLEKNKFDVIILESIFTLPYLELLRKQCDSKIILRTHNVEHLIWSKLAKSLKNPIKKSIFQWMSRSLFKYETKMLPQVDGIACISQEDVIYFQKMGVQVPISHIPVSFSFERSSKLDYKKNDFFFIGAMNWKPNLEAVDVLLKEILPRLLVEDPEIRIHLAGSYMPSWMLDLKHDSIVVHGRAENVKEFMQNNGIMLAPMLSGSGVRIKILEAMAYGIPVISTSKGLLGIPFQQGINAICEDTWDEFAKKALQVRNNINERARIGKEAAVFVKVEYNDLKTTQQLHEFIESL
jgi:glycosyltransferase involved in cell wall biosynthesis